MNSKERQVTLAAFGSSVLHILEADEEWTADTIDLIGSNAINMNLATTDHEGLFKIASAPAASSGDGG